MQESETVPGLTLTQQIDADALVLWVQASECISNIVERDIDRSDEVDAVNRIILAIRGNNLLPAAVVLAANVCADHPAFVVVDKTSRVPSSSESDVATWIPGPQLGASWRDNEQDLANLGDSLSADLVPHPDRRADFVEVAAGLSRSSTALED